jgi:hypothetical protein
MHVHLLRDEDLPADHELVVQRARRHGPTRDPQPAVDAGQPAQVELPLDTGRNMTSRGGQIVRLGAVRRGQERQEPVVVGPRRVVAMVVLALQELDGEWRRLLAELLAQTGRRDGEHDGRVLDSAAFPFALSASAASAASPSLILANHASHGVPAFNVDFAWTLQLSLDRVGQGRRRGTYPFFEMSSSNLPNLPHPRIPAAFACAGTLGIRELAVLVGATVAYERPAGHK